MSEVGDAALNALNVAAAAKLLTITEKAGELSDEVMLSRIFSLFESSVKAAQRLARKEFRLIHGERTKLGAPDRIVGSSYMRSIMSDAVFNMFRISNLLKLGRPADPLKRELRNRLLAGLTAMITRAYSQELMYQYSLLAEELDFVLKKRWKSRLAPNTCPICRAMHGQTVGIDEPFIAPAGTKVYFDLLAPGMHPYCACTIEVVVPVSSIFSPKRR